MPRLSKEFESVYKLFLSAQHRALSLDISQLSNYDITLKLFQ